MQLNDFDREITAEVSSFLQQVMMKDREWRECSIYSLINLATRYAAVSVESRSALASNDYVNRLAAAAVGLLVFLGTIQLTKGLDHGSRVRYVGPVEEEFNVQTSEETSRVVDGRG